MKYYKNKWSVQKWLKTSEEMDADIKTITSIMSEEDGIQITESEAIRRILSQGINYYMNKYKTDEKSNR